MITAEDALALTAIANYTMYNVILRTASDIQLDEVDSKLLDSIKARLPNSANFPLLSEIIQFNSLNGMEWPANQISDGTINYLQDRKNRAQSIYAGIVYLLTSLRHLVTDENYENCLKLINLKFKRTLLKLDDLLPIDDLKKLQKSKIIISRFTHFANFALYPILAHPNVKFLSDEALTVKNFRKVQKLLDHAETFYLASIPRDIVCTISKMKNSGFSIDIAIPVRSYIFESYYDQSIHVLEQYSKLPELKKLSIPLQYMLMDLNRKIEAQPDQLYVASSRADNLPGIRNRWVSGNLLLDRNKDEIFYSENTRMAHISSRSKEISGKEKIKNAMNNLEQIIQEQINVKIKVTPTDNILNINIPFSTLVTPLPGLDLSLEKHKNIAIKKILEKYKNKIIKINNQEYLINLNIFSLNNAVNYGREFLTTSFSGEYKVFFDAAVNEFSENFRQDFILKQLLKELRQVLNNTKLSFYYNRELYLAALVRVISNRLGWPVIGGCISNKDREALRDIIRKSIEEYIVEFKNVPRFADIEDAPGNRQNLNDMCARRYLSGHEQYLAQKNAEGARGTKTPYMYLPKDTQETIITKADNVNILKYSESLAALNDIYKMKMPGQNAAWTNEYAQKVFAEIKNEKSYLQFLIDNKLERDLIFISGKSKPVALHLLADISFFKSSHYIEINANDKFISETIADTLESLKKILQDKVESGKCDQLTGVTIIDTKNEKHRIPTTLAAVYNLFNTASPNSLIECVNELKEVSLDLRIKANSDNIIRKPMIRSLYEDINAHVTLLHQLLPINQNQLGM